MSISGSNETKTAIIEAGAQGTTTTVSKDAQEDREIVGINHHVELADGDADYNGVIRVGSDPGVSDTVEDNHSFNFRFSGRQIDDTVNGVGALGEHETFEWFGHGSGIEWNEDATLTATIVEADGNVTANMHSQVYYREL